MRETTMNGPLFDEVTRPMASPTTRRSVLRRAAALGLAVVPGLGLAQAASANLHALCGTCQRSRDCQPGLSCASKRCVPSGSICGGVGYDCPTLRRLVCPADGDPVCFRLSANRRRIEAQPMCAA